MSRRTTVAALVTVAVVGLTGCSSDQSEQSTSGGGAADMAAPLHTTTSSVPPPGSGVVTPPDPSPVAGTDEQAIELAVEKFAMYWACYRTFADQPQREWFDSWSDLATDEFVQQQRVVFHETWGWTWNSETQVVGCMRQGDIRVADSGDSTAIARITLERHLFHIDAAINDGRRETKTYDVAVETSEARPPQVLGVREVAEDAPFPTPLRDLSS